MVLNYSFSIKDLLSSLFATTFGMNQLGLAVVERGHPGTIRAVFVILGTSVRQFVAY